MNAIKSSLIIALAAAGTALGNAQTLDLADFVLSQSRPSGIPATQPALDGRYYYQQSADGTQILKLDYATGERSTAVLEPQSLASEGTAAWEGYKMSADESKILLWKDVHMIYRHSFSADYYVYDTKRQRLSKLSDAGGEEIATFSPDARRVAYVKDNNIYIKNLDNGQTATVTTDGVKNHVINGVPDWVYQEEFGILNAMAWSPDSRTLAFLRFDESQVPMYSMTLYQGTCSPNDDYEL
ncbi:MAG: DPP IV N-terminal domain-containing protein, partial [Bacteroidales bacterium]|nr:DPP IV N-terminal domain-containing protein [Bacteroidales bacterium]